MTDVATKKTAVIERKIDSNAIANELASRFSGQLIELSDIFNPKTGKFISEDELRKSGASFISVEYKNDITGKLLKKNRVTKEKTTYKKVIQTFKWIILGEARWQKYLEKYSTFESLDGIVQSDRQNGIGNYSCNAVGNLRDRYYINGILFSTIEKSRYFDENGKEIAKDVIADYLPTKSKTNYHAKYGIPMDIKLPLYRSVAIDNCTSVRAFGFNFKPTDNPLI